MAEKENIKKKQSNFTSLFVKNIRLRVFFYLDLMPKEMLLKRATLMLGLLSIQKIIKKE